MSYYAYSKEHNIRIKASEINRLIETYNKRYNESSKPAKEIDDVFDGTGFVPEKLTVYDASQRRYINTGDVGIYFEDNPWHSDEAEELLNMIAPFVEKGSYITFMGEDDCMWAYYFDGESATEYNGEVCFPGMPGEVSYRGLSEYEPVMTNLETIFGKELTKALPQHFIDKVSPAEHGKILQFIAEALFDAVCSHHEHTQTIPFDVLGEVLANAAAD